MKTNQNYSIRFNLKPEKSKSVKAPIYCRITVDCKRVEISLKIFIEPAKWSSVNCRVKGNSEEARMINMNIEFFGNDILRHYNMLWMDGNNAHVDHLKSNDLQQLS